MRRLFDRHGSEFRLPLDVASLKLSKPANALSRHLVEFKMGSMRQMSDVPPLPPRKRLLWPWIIGIVVTVVVLSVIVPAILLSILVSQSMNLAMSQELIQDSPGKYDLKLLSAQRSSGGSNGVVTGEV